MSVLFCTLSNLHILIMCDLNIIKQNTHTLYFWHYNIIYHLRNCLWSLHKIALKVRTKKAVSIVETAKRQYSSCFVCVMLLSFRLISICWRKQEASNKQAQAGLWLRLPVVVMSLNKLNPWFLHWRVIFREFMHWYFYSIQIVFATWLIWATGHAIFATVCLFFSSLHWLLCDCFRHDGQHQNRTTMCDVMQHFDRSASTENFSTELPCLIIKS